MAPPSDADLKAFFARQFNLLDREKDAELERTSLLISKCSQTLLEQRGLALGGLGIVNVSIGLGGKRQVKIENLIEFERPSAYHTSPVFPPHTFRPGDLARVDEHSSGKSGSKTKSTNETPTKPVEGVIYKVADTKIVLAVSRSENSQEDELDLPDRCALIKLANTATHDRMRRAVEDLERIALPDESTSQGTKLRGLNPLHRVLLGLSSPSSPTKHSYNLFFDDALNVSQIKAVNFALNASEVACIHGPPGTGKTRVLVEIIRQLVYNPNNENSGGDAKEAIPKKPTRILVCGASNLAVDNLLERLTVPPTPPVFYSSDSVIDSTKQSDGKTRPLSPILLTRLGHPARVLSALYNQTLDFQVQNSDEAALAKDVKGEIEQLLAALSGKGAKKVQKVPVSSRGGKKDLPATKKGQRLKGEARKEAWKDVRELRKEYRKREGGVVKTVLSKAQVVLSTCHGAGSRQLQNAEFDVVLIDEATQAMEAVCWVPVLKAKKLILAGDPMQLGPTIISEGNLRHRKLVDSGRKPSSQTEKDTVTTASIASLNSETETDSDFVVSEEDTAAQNSEPQKVEKNKQKKEERILRPPKSLNKTMFDRLEDMYGSKIKHMLNVQYRSAFTFFPPLSELFIVAHTRSMNTKIASFPSKTLYHSRLKSDQSNSTYILRDLPDVNQNEEFEDVVGQGTEVVFYDTAGAEFWERSGNQEDTKLVGDDGGSLCNENEAEVVKRWVYKLLSAGLKPSQISIITPYQAQSQLLSRLIPEPGLEIGTADGMQGRENEAIILSLVRSNAEGEVGFLKERRRLNVAMTRAKRHLCVVGDSETISRGGGKYLKRWMKWLEKEADVRFAGDILD